MSATTNAMSHLLFDGAHERRFHSVRKALHSYNRAMCAPGARLQRRPRRRGRASKLPYAPTAALCCPCSQAVQNHMPKHRITPAASQAGWESRIARANQKAADLAPIVKDIQAAGVTSLRVIAAG
jgi:hypothetical protein